MPAAFAAGRGAVTWFNSQGVADYQSNPDRAGLKAGWATAPLPAGPKGRFGFVGGANLAIWKSSEHPGAAFEWVRYLAGQESQQRYAVATGLWPARASAVAGTKLATDPAYAAFAQMLSVGREYPPVAAWIDVETVLARSVGSLLSTTTPLSRDRVAKVLTATATNMQTRIAGASAPTAAPSTGG